MKKFILILSLTVFGSNAFAGSIVGRVISQESSEALIGANVYLKGTTIGTATDEDGMFYIKADDGRYTIVCDYVGYATANQDVEVSGDTKVDFELTEYLFAKTINIIADRARERITPVAFTNIEKSQIEERLGSRDIPLVLNTTPSVYATQQGGGAGDARINVRGFDQNNIAIMINGVPINDMENGWVYWSNWDGVGDATSSIQMQRGLSAVNLATPSIGGTMNVITDPTAQKMGLQYKQEVGNDGFFKTTVIGHSGLINDKFALSGAVVRKIGNGVIDKTWTDAWAYYFGASWNVDESNRLEFYTMAAPQRHGQNLYKQNASVYDSKYAKDELGYSQEAIEEWFEVGREYNQNWNTVSSSYKGKQYWNGTTHDRYNPNFINERENYYHKPLANVNWYANLGKKVGLFTTLYYSGGTGGGTGTYGNMVLDDSTPSSRVDWDATIARNDTNATGSRGILRNSVNNQWTIGAISKANIKVSDKVKTTVGIDWRTAEIEHYREVRDLLGGDYYIDDGSAFWTGTENRRKLGDKIDYNFTNTVGWIGGFAQSEFTTGPVTAYGTVGISTIKYTHDNFFNADASGDPIKVESDWISGFQVKGGAMYRLTGAFDVFGNLGYVSKVPIFDNVIDDRSGATATDPKNEKFISVEAGSNFNGLDGKLRASGNVYYTQWNDRANSIGIVNEDLSEGIIFLTGLDATHLGIELEGSYQPINLLRFDAAASIGNWTYSDDVSGYYKDYSEADPNQTETYYVKDLKVGDAPQTQFALGANVFPVKGLVAQLIVKYYTNHYAAFNPFSRVDDTDRNQSWKAPSYNLIDFHFAYTLPFDVSGVRFQVFGHVFNLLDAVYVQDAVDKSSFNAFKDNGYTHSADDAEVYLGLPRTFNMGINILWR